MNGLNIIIGIASLIFFISGMHKIARYNYESDFLDVLLLTSLPLLGLINLVIGIN